MLPSPQGVAGRLLHTRSISGLFIPFTGVPAYVLPVYASPGTLPYPTQDSVPDCWLRFVRAAITDGWTVYACKAQPPQTRTGAMHACGSSGRASAPPLHRPVGVWGHAWRARSLSRVSDPLERSARRRLSSRGSLGPHFPPFTGRMRRYDCPLTILGVCACRSVPNPLRAALRWWSPRRARCLVEAPTHRQGLWSPGPPLRVGHKEPAGAPTFPSSPCADMPRSQTPVVSWALAITPPGLLPSSHWTPSASHHVPLCGAPSRGLSPRDTRLRTAPCGEARGCAPDLLARR